MDSLKEKLPHWNLDNVYQGLDSQELKQSFDQIIALLDEIEDYIASNEIEGTSTRDRKPDSTNISEMTTELINRLNEIFRKVFTVHNYLRSFTTTDSYNSQATRLFSQIQAQVVRTTQAKTIVSRWLGSLENELPKILDTNKTASDHSLFLKESVDQSNYLMNPGEEALAGNLSLSGIRAWGKLQETITSQLSIDINLDGKIQSIPLPALQNIRRYNPDPELREIAFQAEIKALEIVREPLAACMNGVKGFDNVLNHRRGWENAVHPSLIQARIDKEILEAMMSSIQASFPTFRRYLKKKARRLGKKSLPWWDLFAPVGKFNRKYRWNEAREFIIQNFDAYSPELAEFAQHAFDNYWIDAEPRRGKVGGAFCMRIAEVEESRILCNFDGSLDQVSTIAHELGHGYHIECQKGKNYLQYVTPMTLAETASIFCEAIIMNAALKSAVSPEEELAILETILIGDTQVIVDISSRYLFEKEVFERRKEADLSPDDLCEIMTQSQIATYGDALDREHLHPYMWAWKPHYYRHDISFYNYPYAFGLLFSTGLYALYQQQGDSFIPQFRDLLASTGLDTPDNLAARFGINIRSKNFWEDSLAVIHKRVERYREL